MRLILIRHGEPDYAVDGLTETGHVQARRLAEALADVRIDRIYVSPMGRAQLTANYTVEAKGMSATTLDWLHELDGNYRDRLWAWSVSGSRAFSADGPVTLEDWHERVEYGPHMKKVTGPFLAGLDAFLAEHGYVRQGQRYRVVDGGCDLVIAFFCHGGVTATILSHLLNVSLPAAYSHFAIEPGSRTTLAFEAEDGYGVFRLRGLNDTSHLPMSPP